MLGGVGRFVCGSAEGVMVWGWCGGVGVVLMCRSCVVGGVGGR
jgi:hypothetical protein